MSDAIAVHHSSFGRAAFYELDTPYVTHAHREGHLFFHIDGGFGITTIDDFSFELDRKYAAAVSPWKPHSLSFENENRPSLIFVLYIHPIWFFENSGSTRFALEFGSPRIAITPTINRLVSKTIRVLLQNPIGQDLSDQAHINDLLYQLTQLCYHESWHKNAPSQSASFASKRFNDYRIRRSVMLMQDHLLQDFAMDDLAREVGLSRPHFFKLFRKQMGLTPNIFLNTLRSEKAIDALITTDKSVTDIGLELGFASQASFTRFFMSNVGIPPSDYRRAATCH